MNKLKIILLPTLLTAGLLWNNGVMAQGKKKTAKEPVKTHHASESGGFQETPDGLKYKIVRHGSGTHKPGLGDHIEMNIDYRVTTAAGQDSLVFDSRKMSGNKPVPYQIVKPRGNGDPVEVFMLMVAGDSAVIRYP